MAEPEQDPQASARPHRVADDALANSTPDDVTTFRLIITEFLNAPRFKLITTLFAGVTLVIMSISKFATTAILSLSTLITSLFGFQAQERAADRAAEIERMKLGAPVPDERVGQILQNTEQTNITVRAVAADVQRLQDSQQRISARVKKVEERQQQLPQPPPPSSPP